MASGDPGSTTTEFYGENGPENICHVMYSRSSINLLSKQQFSVAQ